MGAYSHISTLCPNLIEKAKEYNYPESSICIISGDEFFLKKNFPDTYNNLITCKHNRDKRTIIQYGQDLIASWIFEDLLIENLIRADISIEKAGADKHREILPNMRISASSDCIISYNNKIRFLEIMSDYTGYWAKKHKMELRDAKYKKLTNTKSLLIGISISDNKYMILDMSENLEYIFHPSYFLYGGKPAYSISLANITMKDINFEHIANDLITLTDIPYDR